MRNYTPAPDRLFIRKLDTRKWNGPPAKIIFTPAARRILRLTYSPDAVLVFSHRRWRERVARSASYELRITNYELRITDTPDAVLVFSLRRWRERVARSASYGKSTGNGDAVSLSSRRERQLPPLSPAHAGFNHIVSTKPVASATGYTLIPATRAKIQESRQMS